MGKSEWAIHSRLAISHWLFALRFFLSRYSVEVVVVGVLEEAVAKARMRRSG